LGEKKSPELRRKKKSEIARPEKEKGGSTKQGGRTKARNNHYPWLKENPKKKKREDLEGVRYV